jgi:HD-like signal output (HDOD) protein
MDAATFSGTLANVIVRRIEEDRLVLPLVLDTATRLAQTLGESKTGVDDLCPIIERDPVLAMVVARLASNASVASTSIRDMLVRLGDRRVKIALAQAAELKAFRSRIKGVGERLVSLWRHSRAVSLLARDIAGLAGCPEVEGAQLAGLLHESAKIVASLYILEFERSALVHEKGRAPEWLDFDFWHSVVAAIHREVGHAFAEKYPLPDPLQRAVSGIADFDVTNRVSITNVIHFANALAAKAGVGLEDDVTDAEEIDTVLMIGSSLLGIDREISERMAQGIEGRLE